MFSPRAIFRFFYNSFYFILCILLAALLLVTPGDIIYQAVEIESDYIIWTLAATLVFVIIVILFVYSLRLYNNTTVLASIPKAWVPIEKGDLPKRVFKMVTENLDRCAVIAFESRPRVLPDTPRGIASEADMQSAPSRSGQRGIYSREQELQSEKRDDEESADGKKSFQLLKLRKKAAVEDLIGVTLPPPRRPVWGEIEHSGWSSPTSPDLPNLQYGSVLSELPHLIEAKALTQAPPDPEAEADSPMLDPRVVALLERPPTMGLREYLNNLSEFGVLPMDATTNDFLENYEQARFSTRAISNERFRELMRLFADMLRGMGPVDPAYLDDLERDDDGDVDNASARTPPAESDVDDNAPFGAEHSTPRSGLSRTVTQSTQDTQSVRRTRDPYSAARNSSAGTWRGYRTAPSTLNARSIGGGGLSRSSSINSFAHSKQPYHSSSNGSLRSKTSSGGNSGSSVIRLSNRHDQTDLPYVLTLATSR